MIKSNIDGTAMDFDKKIAELDKSKMDMRLAAAIQGEITVYSYAQKRDGLFVDQENLEILEE